MPNRILIVMFCLALALAACQGEPVPVINLAGTTTPAETASAYQPPETEAPAAESTPAPPTEAAVVEAQAPAGCTAVSPQPTPGPTEQSIFPPVNESDWVKGPDDAYVTILEYSDFQ